MPTTRGEVRFEDKNLKTSAGVYAIGFAGLKGEPDPLEKVQEALNGFRERLQRIDLKMSRLLTNNTGLLTWAVWVQGAVKGLDQVEKNLPFYGQRLWNWLEVGEGLGIAFAVAQAGEVFVSTHFSE